MSEIANFTKAPGVFQGDIIIRTGLIAAIQDLRDHPEFLEFCFADLVKDDLTKAVYGENEMNNAIQWILAQNIQIGNALSQNAVTFPCVTIELLEGDEAAATLGDTHYKTSEHYYYDWPKVTGPLTPIAKGTNTLTFSTFNGATVTKTMLIVTTIGQKVPILAVDGFVVTIDDSQIHYDFTGLSIYTAQPAKTVRLESLKFKESYRIGCHVQGEPAHLSYLFSLVLFALLKYKQAYFEHRGFDNMKLSYSKPQLHPGFEESMKVYSRYINMNGLVSQYWPKTPYEKIQQVVSQPSVLDVSLYPVTSNEEAWKGSEDTNEDFEDFFNDPKTTRITYMVDGENDD